MPYKCFLLEPVHQIRIWCRRYSSQTPCPLMPGQYSYHNAMNLLGDFDHPHVPNQFEEWCDFVATLRPPKDAPLWPTTCGCGFSFPEEERQMFTHRLYTTDTGVLTTLADAPPGALWVAWWMGNNCTWDNATEPPLLCKTPGGDWNIDGRANNCTMPEDRLHRCWIRHGIPPNIHVDKNGLTCTAGAGSIQAGAYHGFLHNGELI